MLLVILKGLFLSSLRRYSRVFFQWLTSPLSEHLTRVSFSYPETTFGNVEELYDPTMRNSPSLYSRVTEFRRNFHSHYYGNYIIQRVALISSEYLT